MSNLVQQSEQQVRRYWTEDGLPDLYIGLGFLIYAALLWGEGALGTGWLQALRSAFLVLMIVLGRFVIEWAKQRLTYPRTGYVKYRNPAPGEVWRRFLLALAIGALLALGMVGILWRWGEAIGLTIVWILLPLGFSALLAAMAVQQASPRYGLYAGVALLGGLLSLWLAQGAASPAARQALLNGAGLLASVGAAMLLGGAVTLAAYLRRFPRPEEA